MQSDRDSALSTATAVPARLKKGACVLVAVAPILHLSGVGLSFSSGLRDIDAIPWLHCTGCHNRRVDAQIAFAISDKLAHDFSVPG